MLMSTFKIGQYYDQLFEKLSPKEVIDNLEATSTNDINCYLESMDAAELIDQEREERVKTEVEKLEDKTTLIYV